MEGSKQHILRFIDDHAREITRIGDEIFDHPETIYQEVISSGILKEALLKQGFELQENVANIPTAFCARFGKGSPKIGILAEYDAVHGLSQLPGALERIPLVQGGPGHGCGHNLLAAGAYGAAVAIKEYLTSSHTSGTVIFYGCPAEEGGAGKGFMARDGVFDEADVLLSWHPADINAVTRDTSLANVQQSYHFTGIASHAAISPENGRSALDAVELMNVGVQFLREHITPQARIHYAITDAGGKSPNVVQASASVLYLIRAPKNSDVAEIKQRVDDIARGAALMTGTSVEIKFHKACSCLLSNCVLQRLLQKNMDSIAPPTFTEEEKEFAKSIQQTFGKTENNLDRYESAFPCDDEVRKLICDMRPQPIYDRVLPYHPFELTMAASSDVGDASWVCPTGQINTTTTAALTCYHSWQMVSQGKSGIAHKGTVYASKVLACAAIDLYENPALIEEAKKELYQRRNHQPFISPIPKDVKPGV